MLGVTVPDIHRSLDKAVQATMIPAARVRGIYIDANHQTLQLAPRFAALRRAATQTARRGRCSISAVGGAWLAYAE